MTLPLVIMTLLPAQALADANCDTSSSTSTPTASTGLSACQKDIYASGIYAFDVNSGETANVACGGTTDQPISGSTNAEIIWNFFTASKGLTPVATAGIMGNFNQESGFDPAIKQNHTTVAIPDTGDGHTGYGIAQWTSQDRQAGLFTQIKAASLEKYYGAGYGHPEIDKDIPAADIKNLLTVELNYAWDGDSTKIADIAGQLNAAATTTGDGGSTIIFHKLYERSKDNASQIQQRVNDATKFLKLYGDSASTASAGSVNPVVAATSCAGELGGVATIDDAIPWAMKFVQDTTAKYHPGGHSLSGEKTSDMTSLYQTDDGAVSGGSCWGGTYCGQCTALSGWFVTNMTGYTYGGGNGVEVVPNLKALGAPTGSEPRPFSVFSYVTSRAAGHTGVVLGTLGDGNVITIENNWPSDGVLVVREYNIKKDHPDATFAYVGDKLKMSSVNSTDVSED